ncbi:hypothetical protein CMK11_00170 [Candidatus Poribacteria bacterium]|nr:hypothetical protein [Candidatus Poribacteria bacterium]
MTLLRNGERTSHITLADGVPLPPGGGRSRRARRDAVAVGVTALVSAHWVAIAPTQAQIPGTRIVSRAYDDIWVMDSYGQNAIALTDDATVDTAPRWSPDGSQIVYVAEDAQGGGDIIAMDANGANRENLTPDPASDDGVPAWAPDGTTIVFRRGAELWLMDATGEDQRFLTSDSVSTSEPTWSPDGTQVAYGIQAGDVYEIHVVGTDGINPVAFGDVPSPARRPAWSPDGAQLAFDSGNSIQILTIDTHQVRDLSSPGLQDIRPRWSYDGSRILFQSIGAVGWWQVSTMAATDGSDRVTVRPSGRSEDFADWSAYLAPPTVTIAAPTVDEVFPAGTTDTPLTVAITDHPAPGHWHWQHDSPFPDEGVAGGTHVDAGVLTDAITGLVDA